MGIMGAVRKKFIFDLDDTLIPTNQAYDDARIEFYNWLTMRFGYKCPSMHDVLIHEEKVNNRNKRKYGYMMERFPTSFRETYEHLCKGLGQKPTKREGAEVYDIGMSVFDKKKIKRNGMLPGAKETLEYLAQKEAALYMLTKGDPRIQEPKLALNRLYKWFDKSRIQIVQEKTPEIMLEMLSGDTNAAYAVGNHYGSDIVPALKAGIKAVYIPFETWPYNQEVKKLVKRSRKVIKLDNIGDIKAAYNRLR